MKRIECASDFSASLSHRSGKAIDTSGSKKKSGSQKRETFHLFLLTLNYAVAICSFRRRIGCSETTARRERRQQRATDINVTSNIKLSLIFSNSLMKKLIKRIEKLQWKEFNEKLEALKRANLVVDSIWLMIVFPVRQSLVRCVNGK